MDTILEEQKAYYRERAAEYDEWFYRQGRYDHGAADAGLRARIQQTPTFFIYGDGDKEK